MKTKMVSDEEKPGDFRLSEHLNYTTYQPVHLTCT